MAERVGFEPTYRLLTDNTISSRARYGHFATSPHGKLPLIRDTVTAESVHNIDMESNVFARSLFLIPCENPRCTGIAVSGRTPMPPPDKQRAKLWVPLGAYPWKKYRRIPPSRLPISLPPRCGIY